MAEDRPRRPALLLVLATGVAVVFWVIYLARVDRVVGMIVDDAWYVLLAKALADGHGYTLINSPSPGIHPFYPPFFPFVLSLVFRIAPAFPANLALLKAVSIAAMFATGGLAYHYFTRVRAVPAYAALGIAAATALYPALVFLATATLMSECVFTLLQLAALVAVEHCVGEARSRAALRSAALGGVLAAAAFLTRPAGLGLLLGVPVYLLKEKRARALATWVAAVGLLAGPWVVYARLHEPTEAQRNEQRANIVQPYTVQFWQRVAGRPRSGTITLSELPERLWNNLYEIGCADLGAVAFYPAFRSLEPGDPVEIGQRQRFVSLLLGALAVSGYVTAFRRRWTLAELATPLSLAVSVSWGWEQFRLLLPIVPFVLYYLLVGIEGTFAAYRSLRAGAGRPKPWALATAAIWTIVAFDLYGNGQYIERLRDPAPVRQLKWIRAFDENERLMKWVGARLPADAVIAAQNPALLHLYTGHKTIAASDPALVWELWKRIGVRYLARMSLYPLEDDPAESRFATIYRSGGSLNLRVVDLGDPATRPQWSE